MLRASSLLSGTMRNVVGHLLARRTTAVARWGETAEKNQGNGEETALQPASHSSRFCDERIWTGLPDQSVELLR
jgi:hypothetical protein